MAGFFMSKNINQELLSFGQGNAKLSKSISTFSLPAGHSCPGAHECLTRADPDTGKLSDGRHTTYRCFAASQEAVFTNVRAARWANMQLLNKARTEDAMTQLLNQSLPKMAFAVRIHVSGDFFNQAYFDAWAAVARLRPFTRFYAYTKSLQYWVARFNDIPANLRLVASRGGKFDHLIGEFELPEAVVYFHPEDAAAAGVLVDHDDSLAMDPTVKKFGLLLHGGQPAGSPAIAAIKRMKAEDVTYSYSR